MVVRFTDMSATDCWSETTELLKALLLQQAADTEGPPPQQHSPASADEHNYYEYCP